jgi:hypothetical protein
MDNHKGRADAFCTFSPFESRWRQFIQLLVYWGAPDLNPEIRKRQFLHFGFWTTVRHRDLEQAGVPDAQNSKSGSLLFASVFNGRPDEYIAGFSEHLHAEMDALWGNTAGWEGAADLEKLNAYIARQRRRVNLFFNAYRDDAVGLRKALILRKKLDELADEPADRVPARVFADQLAVLARSLEGSI